MMFCIWMWRGMGFWTYRV